MHKVVALMLIIFFCAGCYTIEYVAPAGSTVTTLSEQQPASFKKDVRVWYALWGLVPITENSTETVIAQNNLKEVRVTTQHTFLDVVIGVVTGFVTIYPKTITVEGNP